MGVFAPTKLWGSSGEMLTVCARGVAPFGSVEASLVMDLDPASPKAEAVSSVDSADALGSLVMSVVASPMADAVPPVDSAAAFGFPVMPVCTRETIFLPSGFRGCSIVFCSC